MSARTSWAGSLESSSEEAKLFFMDFQRLDKSMDSNSAAAFWSFLPAGVVSMEGPFCRTGPEWESVAAEAAAGFGASESGDSGGIIEPPDRNSARLPL